MFRVTAVVPALAPAKFLYGDFAPHVVRASTCHAHTNCKKKKKGYVIILSARMALDFLRANVLGVE